MQTAKKKHSRDFQEQLDPELLDPKYNEVRRPSLPYGIIINGEPAYKDAGILIPEEQLIKADWQANITEEELITAELTEPVTGLLLTSPRVCVLAAIPPYMRFKNILENGDLSGVFIGLYSESRNQLDKTTMEVVSEHALVFFDNQNQPLHKNPIVVRFRNVSLWSFESTKEKTYRQLEKAFAEWTNSTYSGKSDRWRSLGILEVTFKAEKVGSGRKKSYCCKTESITQPTVKNLPDLFLGTKAGKKLLWGYHSDIAGFLEVGNNQLPALATSASSPQDIESVDVQAKDVQSVDIQIEDPIDPILEFNENEDSFDENSFNEDELEL